MNVLHVLNHSLPHVDGYSIRSQSILVNQRRLGIEAVGLTSPKHEGASAGPEDIGGIRFYRTGRERKGPTRGVPFLRELVLIARTARQLRRVVSKERVDVIHAHSPSLNGLAAYAVGRWCRRPVVYEMRSIWEELPTGYVPTVFEKLKAAVSTKIETALLRRVDAVVTISEGLRREVVGRGVDPSKVRVCPNGVDLDVFRPAPGYGAVRSRLGLDHCFVAGFIGSFVYWEGLEVLLRATAIAARHDPKIRVLLVGEDIEGRMQSLASSMGLNGLVTFAGRVRPSDVPDYYASIDLLVYPRLRMRLTDLVTPLKPLEAMASGKLVLASDVGGHRELIENGVTGFLFEAGNDEDLARKILDIARGQSHLEEVRQRARARVERERSWHRIALGYEDLYRTLLDGGDRRRVTGNVGILE